MLQPRARAQDKHSGWVYSRAHGSSSSKYRDSGKEKLAPSLPRHDDAVIKGPAVRPDRRRHRAAPVRFPLLGVMLRASDLHVPRHRTQVLGGGQLHFERHSWVNLAWVTDTKPREVCTTSRCPNPTANPSPTGKNYGIPAYLQCVIDNQV